MEKLSEFLKTLCVKWLRMEDRFEIDISVTVESYLQGNYVNWIYGA